jgi:LPS-assembly protein
VPGRPEQGAALAAQGGRGELTYRDAHLEFYGVPIAYTPYFKHPDPTVDRQSGFLAPTFGNSSALGVTLEVP